MSDNPFPPQDDSYARFAPPQPPNPAAETPSEDTPPRGIPQPDMAGRTHVNMPTEVLPLPVEAPPADAHALPEPTLPRQGASDSFDVRLNRVKSKQAARQSMTGAPPRRRRGIVRGLILPLLITVLVAGALGVIAAFLPPFDQYNPVIEAPESAFAALTSEDYRLEEGGLTVMVHPGDPGTDFAVQIREEGENFAGCPTPPPANLDFASPVYSLAMEGTPPNLVGLELQLPDENSTFVDMVGVYGERWGFIPSQRAADDNLLVTDLPALPACVGLARASESDPALYLDFSDGQTLSDALLSSSGRVLERGLYPGMDGAILGQLPTNAPTGEGYVGIPLIANYQSADNVDVGVLAALLSSPEARQRHVEALTLFLDASAYSGLALDYRGLSPELRDEFSAFISLLDAQLGNRELILILPPANRGAQGWTGGAYDWRTLGLFADVVIVRAPFDPRQDVDGMLAWGVGEISREKLFLGLSALSAETTANTPPIQVTLGEALSGISGINFSEDAPAPGAEVIARVGNPVNARLGLFADVPYLEYVEGETVVRTYWLTTPNVLRQQVAFAEMLGLGGLLIMDWGAANLPVESLFSTESGSLPAEAPAFNWTISTADGNILARGRGNALAYTPRPEDSVLQFTVTIADVPLTTAELTVAGEAAPE